MKKILHKVSLAAFLLSTQTAHATLMSFTDTDDGSTSFSIASEGINYTFQAPGTDGNFQIDSNSLIFGQKTNGNSNSHFNVTTFQLTVDANALFNGYNVSGVNTSNRAGLFDITGSNQGSLASGLTGATTSFASPISLFVGETYTFLYDLNSGNGNYSSINFSGFDVSAISAVPIPAAVWLFGSSLLGIICMRRKHGNNA